MYADFTSTPVYNRPALGYPQVGIYGAFSVPLHLTNYTIPTRTPKLNIQTAIPNIDVQSNLAFGGSTLTLGSNELPKIDLQGFIDTPTALVNGYAIPQVTRFTPTQNLSLLEVMALCYEGGMSQSGFKVKVDPVYFRDPYGRVFSNPRVLKIDGSFVEQLPGRNNFQLTLQI